MATGTNGIATLANVNTRIGVTQFSSANFDLTKCITKLQADNFDSIYYPGKKSGSTKCLKYSDIRRGTTLTIVNKSSVAATLIITFVNSSGTTLLSQSINVKTGTDPQVFYIISRSDPQISGLNQIRFTYGSSTSTINIGGLPYNSAGYRYMSGSSLQQWRDAFTLNIG